LKSGSGAESLIPEHHDISRRAGMDRTSEKVFGFVLHLAGNPISPSHKHPYACTLAGRHVANVNMHCNTSSYKQKNTTPTKLGPCSLNLKCSIMIPFIVSR
jgi:hypothetical protein